MKKYDCDTCEHYGVHNTVICDSCVIDDQDNPTNYTRIPTLEEPQDDHTNILNALATIIEVCEKYQNLSEGCAIMCPLRYPEDEQTEGVGICALESPMPPITWSLIEPENEETYPILLETDYYIDYEEDEDENAP